MLIAIDGPAASGKGSIARHLAHVFVLNWLDTGMLYRATAILVREAGADLTDAAAAEAAAQRAASIPPEDERLWQPEVAIDASVTSQHAGVRRVLLEVQRDFVKRNTRAVLDGRDITTVICPDADTKIFVTASLKKRAERRCSQLQSRGFSVTLDDVERDLTRRDTADRTRALAPLVQSPEAVVLDTSDMNLDEVLAAAVEIVRNSVT